MPGALILLSVVDVLGNKVLGILRLFFGVLYVQRKLEDLSLICPEAAKRAKAKPDEAG